MPSQGTGENGSIFIPDCDISSLVDRDNIPAGWENVFEYALNMCCSFSLGLLSCQYLLSELADPEGPVIRRGV